MANEQNLIPFSKRSESEARDFGRKGGKASGEARRRKADFKKTLNMLLTVDIDHPELTPILEAMGIDSTLESAINMAMIKKALAGNVKAFEAVAKYSGQMTAENEARVEKLHEETEAIKRAASVGDDNDAVMEFIKAMRNDTAESETD